MAHINRTGQEVAEMILGIGDRKDLKTTDKKTVVAAINEIFDYVSKIARATSTEFAVLKQGSTEVTVVVEGSPMAAKVTDQSGNTVLCDLDFGPDSVKASISKPYSEDLTLGVIYIME